MKFLSGLKSLAAAAALAALNAGAAPIPPPGDWGTHGTAEAGGSVASPGAFADAFVFSLAAPTTLFSSAVANNLGTAFGIADGRVALYADVAGPDTLLGSYAFDGGSGDTPHSFAARAAGDYYYLVSGLATGLAGGVYTLTSAVPEPETLALLLAGLLIVWTVSRRRSDQA